MSWSLQIQIGIILLHFFSVLKNLIGWSAEMIGLYLNWPNLIDVMSRERREEETFVICNYFFSALNKPVGSKDYFFLEM